MKFRLSQQQLGIAVFGLAMIGITIFAVIPNPVIQSLRPQNRPDFSFEHVQLTQVNDGVTEWELDAESAIIDKEKRVARLNTVQGIIFGQDEKKQLDFVAESAIVQLDDSAFELFQSRAVYYDQNGRVNLKADQMAWLNKTKQFVGRQNVTADADKWTLNGQRVVVNLIQQTIQFDRQAKLFIKKLKSL